MMLNTRTDAPEKIGQAGLNRKSRRKPYLGASAGLRFISCISFCVSRRMERIYEIKRAGRNTKIMYN